MTKYQTTTKWKTRSLNTKRLGAIQRRQCDRQQHIPLHTASVLTHVPDTSYKVLTRAPTHVQ